MPCFYCGKRVSLVRQLSDADFCSDDHRKRYRELTRLGLNRLTGGQEPDAAAPAHKTKSAAAAVQEAEVVSPLPADGGRYEPVRGAKTETEFPSEPATAGPDGGSSELVTKAPPSGEWLAPFVQAAHPRPEPGRVALIRPVLKLKEFGAPAPVRGRTPLDLPATAPGGSGLALGAVTCYGSRAAAVPYPTEFLRFDRRIERGKTARYRAEVLPEAGFAAAPALTPAGDRSRLVATAEFGPQTLTVPRFTVDGAARSLSVPGFTPVVHAISHSWKATRRETRPEPFTGSILLRDVAFGPIAGRLALAACGGYLVPMPAVRNLPSRIWTSGAMAFTRPALLSIPVLEQTAATAQIELASYASIDLPALVRGAQATAIPVQRMTIARSWAIAIAEPAGPVIRGAVNVAAYFAAELPAPVQPPAAHPRAGSGATFDVQMLLPSAEARYRGLYAPESSFFKLAPKTATGGTRTEPAVLPAPLGAGRFQSPSLSKTFVPEARFERIGGLLVLGPNSPAGARSTVLAVPVVPGLPDARGWQAFVAASPSARPGPAVRRPEELGAASLAPPYAVPALRNVALGPPARSEAEFPAAAPGLPAVADLSLRRRLEEVPPAALRPPIRFGAKPVVRQEVLPAPERPLHRPPFSCGVVVPWRLSRPEFQPGATARALEVSFLLNKRVETAPVRLTSKVAKVETHVPPAAQRGLGSTGLLPGLGAPEARKAPARRLPGMSQEFPLRSPLEPRTEPRSAALLLGSAPPTVLAAPPQAGRRQVQPPALVMPPPREPLVRSGPGNRPVRLMAAEPLLGRPRLLEKRFAGCHMEWERLGQECGVTRFERIESRIGCMTWPTAASSQFQTAPKPASKALANMQAALPLPCAFPCPNATEPQSAGLVCRLDPASLRKLSAPGFREDRKTAAKAVRLAPAMRAAYRPSRVPNFVFSPQRATMGRGAFSYVEVEDVDDGRTLKASVGHDTFEEQPVLPPTALATRPKGDFDWPWPMPASVAPVRGALRPKPGFKGIPISAKTQMPAPPELIAHHFEPIADVPSQPAEILRGIWKGASGIFRGVMLTIPCFILFSALLWGMAGDSIRGKAADRAVAHDGMPYRIEFNVARNGFSTLVNAQRVDFWSDGRLKAGGVGFFSDSNDERAYLGWIKVSYDDSGVSSARQSPQKDERARALAALKMVRKRGWKR